MDQTKTVRLRRAATWAIAIAVGSGAFTLLLLRGRGSEASVPGNDVGENAARAATVSSGHDGENLRLQDPATVSEPTEAPRDPGTSVPDPATAAGAPQRTNRTIVREELSTWARLARERGIAVPLEYSLPYDLQGAFADAYLQYEKSMEAVEAIRMPLTVRLAQEKQMRGEYEEYPHPESAAATPEARKALKVARKPTERHQSVSLAGDSQRMWVIRVNVGDSRELPGLWAAIDRAKDDFVSSVNVLIGQPFGVGGTGR